MNRIHSVPMTAAAIRDCATALRQRSERLYHLAEDAPSTHCARHWREEAGRYGRLATFMSEEFEKVKGG